MTHYYQPLFDYLENEYGLILIQTEEQEIKHIIKTMETTSYYQPLFDYMSNEHGIHFLESEMSEIINIVSNMKKKERIAMLEAEISRLKVANRTTNERLEVVERKLGITYKPEAPECVANNSAPNEGHLREHIDKFFNRPYDAYMEAIEKKIVAEFGEDADISKKFKVMRNTYDVRNLKASIKPDFIPDWKDAPEWATCKAMDADGIWNWHSSKPYIEDGIHEWMLRRCDDKYQLIPNHPPYDKPWTETLEMRPEAKQPEISHYEYELDLINPPLEEKLHEPDYTHLLPDGYEFCSEADVEKWVKVEKLDVNDNDEYPIGHIDNFTCFKGRWRPIRPIQYKVTTHEIVDAVPDPYQPDWSKAPEGTVAHVYRSNGVGHWMCIDIIGNGYLQNCAQSGYTIPPDLDWKQSLRVKPSK